MDKLEEIFRMQDALNQRIGVNLPPATEEEKTKWGAQLHPRHAAGNGRAD